MIESTSAHQHSSYGILDQLLYLCHFQGQLYEQHLIIPESCIPGVGHAMQLQRSVWYNVILVREQHDLQPCQTPIITETITF